MKKLLFSVFAIILVASMVSSAEAQLAPCPSEPVTITEDVTFEYMTCTVTNPPETGFLIVGDDDIVIDCNNALFDVWKIDPDALNTGAFIVNNGYDNVEIRNCQTNNFGMGVLFNGERTLGATPTITSGLISGNSFLGNGGSKGVKLLRTKGVSIVDNYFRLNPTSIEIMGNAEDDEYSAENIVDSNQILNSYFRAIRLVYSDDNIIKNNRIQGAGWGPPPYTVPSGEGILLSYSHNTLIKDSIIETAVGAASGGPSVYIRFSKGVELFNVTLDNGYVFHPDTMFFDASLVIKWYTQFKILVDSVPQEGVEVEVKNNAGGPAFEVDVTDEDGLTGVHAVVEKNVRYDNSKEIELSFNPHTVNFLDYSTNVNIDGSEIIEFDVKSSKLDNTAPEVTLVSPVFNATVAEGDINLTCSASDTFSIASLILYFGAEGENKTAKEQINFDKVKTAEHTFLVENVTPGNYTWNCKAIDKSFNSSFADKDFTLDVKTIVDKIDADGDKYYAGIDDCDDSDKNINPGKAEKCDGIDNNCDGDIDEEDGKPIKESCGDSDIGECSLGERECNDGEWDDCVGDVGPTAEICDGKDNNCNNEIDEAYDSDSDYYTTCGSKTNSASYYPGMPDCNDNFYGINPGSGEQCSNGIDDDCDGYVDGQDTDCSLPTVNCFNDIKDSNEDGIDCGGVCVAECEGPFKFLENLDIMLIAVILVIVIIIVLVFVVFKSMGKSEEESWSDIKEKWKY
ncbi:MAG: MopE-related protein [Nanoarchaeota archaeon]